VYPNSLPRPPVEDMCIHLPRHIINDGFVPASVKEDQKYRVAASRFYKAIPAHMVELEEEFVKESVKHPPGHPEMKKKAAFLEKGRELVAKLTERTGQFGHKSRLCQELMNSFPDVWDRFHKFDGRSNNADGSLKLKDTVATGMFSQTRLSMGPPM
jgi:hypothetical protein